ncbi:MAG TPA: hypothetical protein VJH68_01830, partial [Candidatus Nanoarchaeia archaeon]|nr:hypothetical protein [Candidatus Nanoarchaeia archaeon]
VKPPHLAINDKVSKEAVSQLRIFSMQKFRPKGRGFTPSEIFCIIELFQPFLYIASDNNCTKIYHASCKSINLMPLFICICLFSCAKDPD